MSPHKALPSFLLLLPLTLAAGLDAAPPAPLAAEGNVYRLARETRLLSGPAGEVSSQESDGGTISIAGPKVRFDQGEKVSWILDAGRSELILLRHDRLLYHLLPVPFELEDFARTAEEKALLAERKAAAMTAIEVLPRGEIKRFGDFEASRVDVAGRSPDGVNAMRYELWLSAAMPGDEGLYRALLREFGSADVVMRPLVRKMAEQPGFPVVRRSVYSFPDGKATDERTLVAVERRSLPAAFFAPPAGYSLQPFDLSDWLQPK